MGSQYLEYQCAKLNINTPALRNSLTFQAKQVSLAVCQDFRISKDSSVP